MENNLNTLKIITQAVNLGFVFLDQQEIQDIRYAAEEYLSKMKMKISPGRKVDFEITEITDSVKQGSEVKKGSVLNGIIGDDLKSIYFLDKADVEWIFYIGDTCKIIK